jgi:hypothetical protein
MNILDDYKYKSFNYINIKLQKSNLLLEKIENINKANGIKVNQSEKKKLRKIKKNIKFLEYKLKKIKEENIQDFFKILKKKYINNNQKGGSNSNNLFFNETNFHFMIEKKNLIFI